MDAPEVETVLFACQVVDRLGAFKSVELTMLLTRSFVVLAPFDQAKVRRIRETRTADAGAQGASRFQQMWHAAQAPFALIDGYVGMTIPDVLAELPTARVLGYADIQEVALVQAPRWAASGHAPPEILPTSLCSARRPDRSPCRLTVTRTHANCADCSRGLPETGSSRESDLADRDRQRRTATSTVEPPGRSLDAAYHIINVRKQHAA